MRPPFCKMAAPREKTAGRTPGRRQRAQALAAAACSCLCDPLLRRSPTVFCHNDSCISWGGSIFSTKNAEKLRLYTSIYVGYICGDLFFILSLLSSPTADIISTVEFNFSGDLLATGDKGGRVVIFQREQESKSRPHSRGEYNVYSTFQSHEPEFDYLKSLEIEEKINKIRWLPQQNAAHFLLSTNDKTIKLWKISERDKRAEGYNLKDEDGRLRDPFRITSLRVPILKPMDLMVEASPRRIFANAHTYHINSISVNSDHETYLSADDLRINLWHLEITDRSFRKTLTTLPDIVDIKPANMEELTEVITAAEFHPHQCNVFVYSSSKGTIRLCDMRDSALCDRHSKFFEEPEDPSSRSFFSEIISSISDVKFSNSGRYMMTRDYLSVKVWDLNMESRPVETYQVHEYLRSKLCSLYENDCIFDKFECCWNGSDRLAFPDAASGNAAATHASCAPMFNMGDACVFLVAFSDTCVVFYASVGRKKMQQVAFFLRPISSKKRRTRFFVRCVADAAARNANLNVALFTMFTICTSDYTGALMGSGKPGYRAIMTGSYNNFFRMFDRNTRRDITLEASRESSKPRAILKPRKVCTGGKRKKDEINVDSLDFNKKILHTAWHPKENIIAVAATNNLYIFQDKVN
ncbi:unnamed protein product [Ranitomeya imitator]|uniref:Serine/threonine-protein phosphatase 2A 55 kDa regulatory subunit B n=1 Tax=Ranitomeya imitator TaxID=111125 RepID=A0ABN9KTR3_9NEOB|nr:unnamed protein product [Ranitomeya imitator]